jgi:hypothetical protein
MSNLLRVIALGAALVSGSAFAADAGKALFVIGDVKLDSAAGGTAGLAKNARLAVGDTVITGGNGRAQLLLNDNTKIALRPNTQFQIKAFSYSEEGAAEQIAIADTESRFELLKGGFRSITGDGAKRRPEGFAIMTPVAVIGIRGTDFVGRLCNEGDDCGTDLAPGLYLGVNEGVIYTSIAGKEYDVYDDQFGFVGSSGFSRLPDLPSGVLDSGLGTQPANSGKATNRFISIASDPAVSSTPVSHKTPSSQVSNAVEPAGHEDSHSQ